MKAISLGYHDVADEARVARSSARPGIVLYTLNREDFRSHLCSIQQQDTSIGTIRRYRQWEREVPVFLTFDDGAVDAYAYVADELEKHNWRGHFFITTNWIGQPDFLSCRQIRELHDRGHVVGSHSCSHPARMSHLETAELVREWAHSCSILSQVLEERVRVASVPDGYYSPKVGQAAAAVGIEVLFTSEPTVNTSVLDGCLILGRYCIRRHTSPAVAGAIAAGRVWPRLQQTVLWGAKKPIKALAGESYFTIRRYITRSLRTKSSHHNP